LPTGSRATDVHGGASAIKDFLTDEILTSVQNLRPIADELGITMAQLAIAWVLANDNVSAAIVGASRPEQVSSNVQASGVKLDAAVLARIDDAVGRLVVDDPTETASPEHRVA